MTGGLILANFTSVLPWGLWLSLYIYFIGLSAGSFLLSTLIYVFQVKRFEPVGRMALFQALETNEAAVAMAVKLGFQDFARTLAVQLRRPGA